MSSGPLMWSYTSTLDIRTYVCITYAYINLEVGVGVGNVLGDIT